MEIYAKETNGNVIIKPRNEIVVIKNGMQHINPSHDLIIEDGWTQIYIDDKPEEEFDYVQDAKKSAIIEINEYDSSENVNSFFIGGIQMWLDKATRVGLMLRFDAEKWAGRTETTLWSNGMKFTLPLDVAIQMLQAIELYASACYDITQMHISNVMNMDNISDIMSYDYKKYYPEKLNFAQ